MYEPASRRRRRRPEGSEGAADIVAALERLLAERPIEAVTVTDILREANVARGTFYFWFTSKYDVVAHAHRTIGQRILTAAAPWYDDPESPPAMIRPVLEGLVATYTAHAPVLRAASESWHSQPEVRETWDVTMNGLIDNVSRFIAEQQRRGIATTDVDARLTAEALVWMNERTLYMASAGASSTPLGDDLANALADVWMATLYGHRAAHPTPRNERRPARTSRRRSASSRSE